MKRILCLILAVMMTFGVLVSCEDNLVEEADVLLGENADKKPVVLEKVVLDFYIISGEGSSDYANQHVANKIKAEFEELYNTTVNMHYVPAGTTDEEYKAMLLEAHPERKAGQISIALVNNADLYKTLEEKDLLVNLYSFYSMNTYGTLKKQISNLWPLTVGTKTVKVFDEASQTEKDVQVTTSYAVPNNHVFGQFEYILVNKALAKVANEVTAAESCDSVADADELKARFEEHFNNEKFVAAFDKYNSEHPDAPITRDQVVQSGVVGNYEDITAAAEEWYYFITDYPEASIEDVYSSSFVVLGDEALAERAMQVIYKFNTDKKFRDLLQYGVEGIHFESVIEDGETVGIRRIISEGKVYSMYLKYTGDVFTASYCLDDEDTEAHDGMCIFCTNNDKCDDGEHIYWLSENRANCELHVANIKQPTKVEPETPAEPEEDSGANGDAE